MISVERQKFSLRKNDQVAVIAGKEKGKVGKVLHVDSKTGRVTVERINLVKRHTKPTQASTGGIVEKELPVHYSNVLILCPKCNKGVRHKSVAKAGDKTEEEQSLQALRSRFGSSVNQTGGTQW